MQLVTAFLPLLSLLGVAVQHVAARYGASILYPNASSVWYRDYSHNVTWDTKALPSGAESPIIRLFKNGQDTAQILAKDFDLTRGRVEVRVPWVINGSDYQIKMFFDSPLSTTNSSTNNVTGPANTSVATTDCWMMTSSTTGSTISTDPNLTATSTTPTATDTTAATAISNSTTTTTSSTSVPASTSSVILPVDVAAGNSTTTATSTNLPNATTTSTTVPATTDALPTTGSSTTAAETDTDGNSDETATGTDTTTTAMGTEAPVAGSTTVVTSAATTTTTTTTIVIISSSTAAAPSSSGNVTSLPDDPVTFFMSATFTIVERPDTQGTVGNGTAANGTSSMPPQGMLMGRRWRYRRTPSVLA